METNLIYGNKIGFLFAFLIEKVYVWTLLSIIS